MHRSCSCCRHWQRFHEESDLGRCRRFPPVPAEIEVIEDVVPRVVIHPDWPSTLANERCGEFARRVPPTSLAAPFVN